MIEPGRIRRLLLAGALPMLLAPAGGCGMTSAVLQALTPEPERVTVTAPEWRAGDRWVYSWTAGPQSGVKTVEVLGTQALNETEFYLVRIGDLDHFYTRDLGWAGGARDNRVELRMTPPVPWYVWPLEVGRRWTYRGVLESRNGKVQRDDVFTVVALESVEVPAGRFRAFRLLREARTDGAVDQYWYAPEARSHVKWTGTRNEQKFEELLTGFRPAPEEGASGGAERPSRSR